jgi:hypothetical protein
MLTKFIAAHLLKISNTFCSNFAILAAQRYVTHGRGLYSIAKHISSCSVCSWSFLLASRQRPLLHSKFSRFMNHFSKRLIYNLATPLLLSSWKPFSLFLLYVKKYEEKYCSKNINYLSHSGRKFTSCLHLRHTEFMQFPSGCAQTFEWPISCFRTDGWKTCT